MLKLNYKNDKIESKGDLLDNFEKKMILKYYKKFIDESLRQLGDKND